VISDFFAKNDAILSLLSKDEQMEFRTRISNDFTNRFINTKSTWKQMADYLVGFTGTWDNYALCVIFLYIIKDMQLESYVETFPKLNEYIQLLKSILLASPDQRLDLDKTKEAMSKFNSMNRKEKRNVNRAVLEKSKTEDYNKQIYNRVMNTKIENLKNEKKIYDAL
jgi:hypothetical protein